MKTTHRSIPPDGGWGWVVVAASFLLLMMGYGPLYSLSILYVSWLEEFQALKGTTSWIVAVAVGLSYCLAPLPSGVARRYGYRVVTIIGACLFFVGFFLSYFATSVFFLVITIGVIVGIGASFSYLPAVAVVGLYFTKRRALAMGIALSGIAVGTFVFAPIINWLNQEYAWRGCVLILSAVVLNAVICGSVMRPVEEVSSNRSIEINDEGCQSMLEKVEVAETEIEQERVSIEDPRINKKRASHFANVVGPYIQVLRNGHFFLFAISNFVANLSFLMPMVYMVDRAVEDNIDKTSASILLSINGAGSLFGRIAIGLIADIPCVDELMCYILSLVGCGVSTGLSAFCGDNMALHGIYAFVFGCSIGGYSNMSPVVTATLVEARHLGIAFSIILAFEGPATMIGTPFAGWIVDWTGSYKISYIVNGIIFVLAGSIPLPVYFLRRNNVQTIKVDAI